MEGLSFGWKGWVLGGRAVSVGVAGKRDPG